MSKKLKVLIVEDSKSSQLLLSKIIDDDPEMEVIGIAENGLEAIEMLKKTKPDVATMDILMPGMSGFEAIRKIMATTPLPIVVISSKANSDIQQVTFEAIECGAVAVLGKPPGYKDPSFLKAVEEIRTTLKSIKKINLERKVKKSDKAFLIKHPDVFQTFKAVAIGASLGGPEALKEVLSNLDSSIDIPIFIVQHISMGFTKGFTQWLDAASILPVCTPEDGTLALGGHIYVAPDNVHMVVEGDGRIHLIAEDEGYTNRPSVSKLFHSMAQSYGPKSIGVLLTGMGRDGAAELLEMKMRGALTIAQDRESSLAFGMPGAAAALGGAQQTLPLKQIAPFLNKVLIKKTVKSSLL